MVITVTAPTTLPVSVTEAKEHLRLTDPTENTYVSMLISAATDHAQSFLSRALAPATYELVLDEFPADCIAIPLPPLVSIESVTYIDADGATQTLAVDDYETDTVNGRVVPADAWPTTKDTHNAVRIRFIAGYEDAPCSIKAAILLLVADLYENREAFSTASLYENKTVKRLLWPHRVW